MPYSDRGKNLFGNSMSFIMLKLQHYVLYRTVPSNSWLMGSRSSDVKSLVKSKIVGIQHQ